MDVEIVYLHAKQVRVIGFLENKINFALIGKTFTAASTLYHHKRGVHMQEKPYTCKICGQGFNFHHSMKVFISIFELHVFT